MRKADVVNSIADKTGVHKADVIVTLEAFFTEVKESLVRGEPVFIRGFGTFGLKKRAAKIGQNIKQGGTVMIPERVIPFFKPAIELAKEVKENVKEVAEVAECD